MRKPRQLRTEDAAYIAGLIDGEGHVGIMQRQKRTRTARHSLTVQIRMTDALVLEWVHAVAGGSLYYNPQRNPKHKPIIHWRMEGKNAVVLLDQLYPYLKTKKPHADVAFRYAETLHKMYRGCPNREHTLIVRDNLRKEIRVLNKRGF